MHHIDIWLLDKIQLDKIPKNWKELLAQHELERAQRFHFAEDQQSFIMYHACKRLILSRYLNQPPQNIEIAIKEKGKPYLPHSTVKFNLSHTKDMAILAVANNIEVGVDIEKIKLSHDYLAIAKRFFHPKEYDYLNQIQNTEKQQEVFYQFWTAKEATLKATGEGIVEGLDATIITLDDKNNIITSKDGCVLKRLDMPVQYIGAIAALSTSISLMTQSICNLIHDDFMIN